MDDAQIRRVTAVSGIVLIVLMLATVPLYFVYSGPPPAANVFTRTLIGLISFIFLLLFIEGFSDVLRRADQAAAWLAGVFRSAGLLFLAVALIALSLEAGVVFGAPDGTLDPTIDGPLAEGNILIQGSIKRLLTAIMLVAAGMAVLRTRIVPRWIAHAGFLIAAFNLFFLPSMFFGKDATQFYSAIGWGNSAFCASFLGYWILAVGVCLLRRPTPGPAES
jgi:hypothetical protein